jgi:hypothetical protein
MLCEVSVETGVKEQEQSKGSVYRSATVRLVLSADKRLKSVAKFCSNEKREKLREDVR